MALYHQQQQQSNPSSDPLFLLVDSLYCQEEQWDAEETEHTEELNEQESFYKVTNESTNQNPSLYLLEQDLISEDEELDNLFTKEQSTHFNLTDPSLALAHREAVEWILRVNAHYSFSALTSVLAVNYLDRFLATFTFQRDKPWMTQLASVACLSLAAKIEETQVPLLLDLQVEDAKFVFEAKTIQRMELLVLSTLGWRMNPITPISFIEHIIRRLGLKNRLHWDFLRRCERLILSVISDSRFVLYLPSVLATATMLQVIDQVEFCNPVEYQNQLMGILKISKDKVEECWQLILEYTSSIHGRILSNKRKYSSIPSSPNGVIDVSFSCENSNDSWALGLSVSSSPEPLFKKSRGEDQQMRLPSFNHVLVDVLSSPP